MGHWLLLLLAALVVAGVVWGVMWMITGRDAGLDPVEPDGAAVPLPNTRPLTEQDVAAVRFDTALRGYRMVEVDAALRRAAYDIGYKEELINVLEAEIAALRDGRRDDAEVLRAARESALKPTKASPLARHGQAPEPKRVDPGAATRPDTRTSTDAATGLDTGTNLDAADGPDTGIDPGAADGLETAAEPRRIADPGPVEATRKASAPAIVDAAITEPASQASGR